MALSRLTARIIEIGGKISIVPYPIFDITECCNTFMPLDSHSQLHKRIIVSLHSNDAYQTIFEQVDLFIKLCKTI